MLVLRAKRKWCIFVLWFDLFAMTIFWSAWLLHSRKKRSIFLWAANINPIWWFFFFGCDRKIYRIVYSVEKSFWIYFLSYFDPTINHINPINCRAWGPHFQFSARPSHSFVHCARSLNGRAVKCLMDIFH